MIHSNPANIIGRSVKATCLVKGEPYKYSNLDFNSVQMLSKGIFSRDINVFNGMQFTFMLPNFTRDYTAVTLYVFYDEKKCYMMKKNTSHLLVKNIQNHINFKTS